LRSKMVFILAVVFGLITAGLAYKYLNDTKQSMDKTEYIKIIVAAQDVPAKTKLNEKMLTFKEIPKKYKHVKETANLEDVANKILLVPVTAGQSIMTNQVLAADDSREGLAYLVPQGKRALAVPVDEVSGVAGLIKPGDRVDVLTTVVIDDIPYTAVPLQDIEVLAVDKEMNVNFDASKKPLESNTVTVAVTFAQAKRLMMASQRGAIRLMLRSPIDNTKGYSAALKLEDLLKENITDDMIKENSGGDSLGTNQNLNSK